MASEHYYVLGIQEYLLESLKKAAFSLAGVASAKREHLLSVQKNHALSLAALLTAQNQLDDAALVPGTHRHLPLAHHRRNDGNGSTTATDVNSKRHTALLPLCCWQFELSVPAPVY